MGRKQNKIGGCMNLSIFSSNASNDKSNSIETEKIFSLNHVFFIFNYLSYIEKKSIWEEQIVVLENLLCFFYYSMVKYGIL